MKINSPSLKRRFSEKVDRSGGADACHIWTACVTADGYGRIVNGRTTDGKLVIEGAHRVAWMLVNGPIPEGMHVLHRCDNPPCCNEAHLFLGTHQENMADMIRKGRHVAVSGDGNGSRTKPEKRPRGTNHYKAKIDEKAVVTIRGMVKAKAATHREMADYFGLSRGTVYSIVHKQIWAHVV